MKTIYTTIIIALLLFFIWFILTFKKRKKRNDLKRKVLADSENNYRETAKNIALSISKSKTLYKSLIIKVHPDRFFDEKGIVAKELSAKITSAKKDYQALIELEKEVEVFLKK